MKYVFSPSPSPSLVARQSICSSSMDQSIMSAAWILSQMSHHCNSSESLILTMSSHSFSAQLQATVFEIKNTFWYVSQVDYQTQTPNHVSETGELCDRIATKFFNSLLRFANSVSSSDPELEVSSGDCAVRMGGIGLECLHKSRQQIHLWPLAFEIARRAFSQPLRPFFSCSVAVRLNKS